MKLIRIFFFSIIAIMIVGCAAPVSMEFQPKVVTLANKKIDAELKAISVKTAKDSNINWYAIENGTGEQMYITSTGTGVPIINQWRVALTDSLNEKLIFKDDAKNKVNLVAEIEKIKLSGISSIEAQTVTFYRIINREDGRTLYSKRIETVGIAGGTEVFIGAHRSRLALVRSIQENINSFLIDLENNGIAEK